MMIRVFHHAIELLKQFSKFTLNESEWIKLDKEFCEVPRQNSHTIYRMRKRILSYPLKAVLYHGTGIHTAGIILARQGLTTEDRMNTASNFDKKWMRRAKNKALTHGLLFGPAVYLGKRNKAFAYVTRHNYYKEAPKFGVLIEVSVDLGTIFEAEKSGNYSNRCDTVHGVPKLTAGILRNEEWAVYDTKRITIIGFEIVRCPMIVICFVS